VRRNAGPRSSRRQAIALEPPLRGLGQIGARGYSPFLTIDIDAQANFMARKSTTIILDKLARESGSKLESMVTELASDSKPCAKGLTPTYWSRRFTASGKNEAAKVRS
jgi:hypothetical protein